MSTLLKSASTRNSQIAARSSSSDGTGDNFVASLSFNIRKSMVKTKFSSAAYACTQSLHIDMIGLHIKWL